MVAVLKYVEGKCSPAATARLQSSYSKPLPLPCGAKGPLATWFPELWKSYKECIASLEAADPSLHRPSRASTFPAFTLNSGPQTVCWPHRDPNNLIYGLCLDWILGNFDPAKGGHLILHEPKLILQLAPGRIALFPSACVTHENLPVADGETRYSVVGYAAGAFWRWIDAGFQTLEDWATEDMEAVKLHQQAGEERWGKGCRQFKSLGELIESWEVRHPPSRPVLTALTCQRSSGSRGTLNWASKSFPVCHLL